MIPKKNNNKKKNATIIRWAASAACGAAKSGRITRRGSSWVEQERVKWETERETIVDWPGDVRRVVAVRANVALESGSVADLGHAALQVLAETQPAHRRLCTPVIYNLNRRVAKAVVFLYGLWLDNGEKAVA